MSNQQIQKVKVKRLAHVGLWATDVIAQARFYRQALGLQLRNAGELNLETEDSSLFFEAGDARYCLGLFSDTRPQPGNGRQPSSRTQLHHISFEVGTDAELAALAARLKISGIDLVLGTRDGDPDLGDTLWFNDPDGNRIEISVTPDDLLAVPSRQRAGTQQPLSIQHLALRTQRLETMVEFYTEALGFDISDWLLRECAWLRCNSDHHTLVFSQGQPGIDHIGYSITSGTDLLRWCDHLGLQQVPLLWGPGRHGAGNDLFLQIADSEGVHLELSAEITQYYDHDATTPPRLWHTRAMAFNLWGTLPAWLQEEVNV
ncbi:MAG: VOC family protein [Ktedonobacteraceae bacterium]|nr:VOC family protein [Ktedonobacteraceae bacterium]